MYFLFPFNVNECLCTTSFNLISLFSLAIFLNFGGGSNSDGSGDDGDVGDGNGDGDGDDMWVGVCVHCR